MPNSHAASITANASSWLSPCPNSSGAEPTPPKLPHPRANLSTGVVNQEALTSGKAGAPTGAPDYCGHLPPRFGRVSVRNNFELLCRRDAIVELAGERLRLACLLVGLPAEHMAIDAAGRRTRADAVELTAAVGGDARRAVVRNGYRVGA